MIEIQNLKFQYKDSDFQLAIDHLSIQQGAAISVVGPSGSGKTTLLNLLAGITVAGPGQVVVAGTDLQQLSESARRNFRISSIGLIFQEFELIEYLNVRENILLPYFINQSLQLGGQTYRQADQLASSVGLSDKLKRPVRNLSQGERQRVAICRALLPGPKLLLADEPTGNLDPTNKQLILQILMQQARASQATLIVVTHDHRLLDQFEQVIDVADFQLKG